MSIVFIDIEVNDKDKVVDYGAYIPPNQTFHGNRESFQSFIKGNEYICGHNALMHDVKYLTDELKVAKITKAQLKEIAELKMPDLNAGNVEAAMKIIAGSARSMGVTVEE